MAYLPNLTKKRAMQAVTGVFAGINRAETPGDGEFAQDMNLSTREYPMLCPRRPRGTVRTLTNPAGMIAKDKLCWVDGETVYYNGTAVAGLTLSTAAADNPKQLVGMGAYVVIFPDKKYFNTAKLTDYGSLEDEYESSGNITYTMCRLDGTDYGNVDASATEPEDPENGDYWIDTSGDEHRLMMYSTTYGMWQQIMTVYTRIAASGISDHFREGDAIEISGAAGTDQIAALNGNHYVYASGSGWITVLGLLDASYTQTEGRITASRKCPDMEYVIESGNRLWGCHYGADAEGNPLNEIYACKLGDFRNWRVYQGISTDSYAVSLGSDGPFTGAVNYGGMPMFFKETCVHKVYGNQPRNYQIMDTQMRGVKRGCGGSICNVDGTLLYMSPTGVEAYDGSLPSCVSVALGEDARENAVAGCLGTRYYLSCMEGQNAHLYVYDMRLNIWHEEDGAKALVFVAYDNDLYMLEADNGKMLTMNGSAGTKEAAVAWSAETGIQGWEQLSRKVKGAADAGYATRYNIRAVVPEGANIKICLQYDEKGVWHEKLNLKNMARTARTMLMPVYPRRCDHLRMRISGTGEIKVHSITRVLTGGGDGQHG